MYDFLFPSGSGVNMVKNRGYSLLTTGNSAGQKTIFIFPPLNVNSMVKEVKTNLQTYQTESCSSHGVTKSPQQP